VPTCAICHPAGGVQPSPDSLSSDAGASKTDACSTHLDNVPPSCPPSNGPAGHSGTAQVADPRLSYYGGGIGSSMDGNDADVSGTAHTESGVPVPKPWAKRNCQEPCKSIHEDSYPPVDGSHSGSGASSSEKRGRNQHRSNLCREVRYSDTEPDGEVTKAVDVSRADDEARPSQSRPEISEGVREVESDSSGSAEGPLSQIVVLDGEAEVEAGGPGSREPRQGRPLDAGGASPRSIEEDEHNSQDASRVPSPVDLERALNEVLARMDNELSTRSRVDKGKGVDRG